MEPKTPAQSREEGFARIQALIASFTNSELDTSSLNEAETRLRLVDEVLECLGWAREDFNPERRVGHVGYTDYLLSAQGTPRLIVEAKRAGQTFRSIRRHEKTEYQVSYLKTAFGADVLNVFEQARKYSSETGVAFALLTNGREWIAVQLLPPPTRSVGELKCFHAGDVLGDHFDFELLWSIASRASVTDGALEESFSRLNAVESEFCRFASRDLRPLTWYRPESNRADLEEFHRSFFDEMVDDARANMLEYCFVTNAKLSQYENSLKRYLKDTAPSFIERASDIEPASADDPNFGAPIDVAGRVILIVGSVGCGKSTFVHRSLARLGAGKSLTAILVDLIDELDTDLHRFEDVLWQRVFDQWVKRNRDKIEFDSLRRFFQDEIDQIRHGPSKKIFKRSPERFDEAVASFLETKLADPQSCLTRAFRYQQQSSHEGQVVFLDNVDRASEEIQRAIYTFAHRLANATGASVIVPLREMTYFRGRESGFLDVRNGDTVYHLQAPDVFEVLSKRLKYVRGHLKDDGRYQRWGRWVNRDELLGNFVGYALELQRNLLSDNQGAAVVKLLAAISWHDVRQFFTCLKLVHENYADERRWTTTAVVGLMAVGPAARGASLPNIFNAHFHRYPCTFLHLRILFSLLYGFRSLKGRAGASIPLLLSVHRTYGYQDRWIRQALVDLVRSRVIECLEAPMAMDYTRGYEISGQHTFRASPLGLLIAQEISKNRAYLAVAGLELCFHEEGSYSSYVDVLNEHILAADEESLSSTGVELLADSEAADIVADYVAGQYSCEAIPDNLRVGSPEIDAVETRVHQFVRSISPRSLTGDDVGGTSGELDEDDPQLILSPDVFVTPTVSLEQPAVEVPQNASAVRIGNSEIIPATLWALVHLRARGHVHCTGVAIADAMNAFYFEEKRRKRANNVSKTLRGPVLRKQHWLNVIGKKGAWRYSLGDSWREAWSSVFSSEPPKLLEDD